MAHSIVVGMSESGKSFLSKMIATQAKTKGEKIAVLDPISQPGEWLAEFFTQDADSLIDYAKKNNNLWIFVDEGGTSLNKYDRDKNWLATQGRHYGHICFFICQRVQQISADIRGQCTRMYVFQLGAKDAAILAEEFNKPELKDIPSLKKGEFFEVSRYEETKKCHIDFATRSVTILDDEIDNETTNDIEPDSVEVDKSDSSSDADNSIVTDHIDDGV